MVLHSAAQRSAVLPNIAFEPIGYPRAPALTVIAEFL